MALAPTDIKQQIDEKLLKLRQLHDDPNSDISDATRAQLKSVLYDQNLLQKPTGPITPENVFPLSNEVNKAASDVYSGHFAPWDPQHPFASIGQKLREVAGAALPITQPVAGALDVMALPIRAVGRPAIESALNQDPQLNFLEKAARSLTTDRDVGNVAARRTAADFPSIVSKYQAEGMDPQAAADRAQGDLTRNWMIGGTAENIMNLLDPVMLTKLLGRAAPKAAAAVAGAPPTIPGMSASNVPAPDFSPNIIEQSAGKQPLKMVETMDGMQPVLEQTPFPGVTKVNEGISPTGNRDLHSLIWEKLKGQDVSQVRSMLHEMNQRLSFTQGARQLSPEKVESLAQQVADNFLRKQNKPSSGASKKVSPADAFMVPGGGGQLGFRGFINKKTANQIPPPAPNLAELPFGPYRDQGQQEFDFTKGPAEPPVRDTAASPALINPVSNVLEESAAKPELMPQDNMIQMSAQMQREIDQIARTPNGARPGATDGRKSPYHGMNREQIQDLFINRVKDKPVLTDDQINVDTSMSLAGKAVPTGMKNLKRSVNEEMAAPEDLVNREQMLDTTARVADEMKRLRQEPSYYENFDPRVKDAVDNLVEDHFAASKTGDKAEVARIESILSKVMDDTGAVHPGITPEQALQALKYPTPLEDLKTIIGGIEPAGGLNANVPRAKLSPEAKAAIQRWKDIHGPLLMEQIKASGKSALSYLKEQFPEIPDNHLKEMSKALEDTAVPVASTAVAKEDVVPVTTKEGRGQYKGKVNLSTYSNPEVAGKIMDIVDANPGISKGMKLTDKDVSKMADEINSGDRVAKLWKEIQASPTGQLRAEARAEGAQLASKIQALLKTDFGKDVAGLGKKLDEVLKSDVQGRTKGFSEIGGTLREGGLPVAAQKSLMEDFEKLLDKYKKDPVAFNKIRDFRKVVIDPEFRPSLWDKAYYIWINGLLSGPKTQIVNTASNALHLLNKFPDRALESILDMGISTRTGARSTTMDEIPKMWGAMFSKDELPEAFRYNAGIKTLEDSKSVSPLQGKISSKLEPAMYGTKLLAKSDQFFGNKVAQMEHAALQGKGLTDMELKNLIGDEAALRTLTRAPAAVTKVLLYAKQNLPGFRWVAPFIRTSADIIGQATEHTPVGAYGIAKSAKAGTLTQRELTQRISRITKGTLLGVWAYQQWKKGNLVGDAPKDTKSRQHFLEVQHKQENALKVGSKWLPLATVEPVGSVLSEFVNFFEGADKNYKDSKSAANAFMSGVMKAGVALGNKRYLAGVSNVMNAAADPEQNAPKVLGQIAAGFVPGAVKTVTDQMDTKVRKADTIPDMIKKRIPGMSETLPPVRDVFGRDTTKPSGLNLFNIKDATLSREDKVVENTPMSKPNSTINGHKLLPQEVALLQKLAGTYKSQMIDKFASRLENMDQDRKQYFVTQLSTVANERARAEFLRNHPKYRPTLPFSKKTK